MIREQISNYVNILKGKEKPFSRHYKITNQSICKVEEETSKHLAFVVAKLSIANRAENSE